MNKTAIMLWIVVLITFAAASAIWYRAKTGPPGPEATIRAEEPARPAGQVEPRKIEDFALTDSEEMEFDNEGNLIEKPPAPKPVEQDATKTNP